MTYKAFISYSHSADDKLAPALQSALHRFAKPFYRLRAIKVFRDKTSLRLTPELWPLIQQALASSEYFLLMCSPDAAKSHWVQNEVAEWLRLNGNAEKLLLVLTEGEIVWDDVANDFDWQRTNALPANLRQAFPREPLYSDLRWARKATDLSLRNPQFLDEIGSLGATLHGRPKDEMIGNDVRQHRLFKSISAAAIMILIALTAAASAAAVYANKQKNEAVRQTVEAERQRRTALEAAERERQAAARERQAAESEKIARQNEENQRKKAEQATKNETVAKNQAEDRRREAERQRQIADDRRREAERQQNLASSRELAASADSQLKSDPELSLLLSLKAHERTATAEAEDALRHSLMRSRVRATFKTMNWYKTAYSPDGKWFLLLTSVAEVIEPGTWKVVAELKGRERWSSVSAGSFSHDGKTVVTISFEPDAKPGLLRVWETGTWRLITEIPLGKGNPLTDVRLSPNDKFALTWGSLRDRPRMWNLATRESVVIGDQERFVEGANISPDGKIIGLVEREESKESARLWDSASGKLLHEADCKVLITSNDITFSPDGKHAVVLCSDETAKILKVGSWETVAVLREGTRGPSLAVFSPDGKWLVTTSIDRTALIWRTDTWQTTAVLRGHTGDIKIVNFTAGGRLLVTASHDGTARIWDTNTWSLLTVLQGHTKPMHDLALSPDGRYVVTTATDSTARVWEVSTGDGDTTEIAGAAVSGLGFDQLSAYSPDGRFIVTRSAVAVLEVWEPSIGRRVAELARGNFLGFSPDGKYAFTTDISGKNYQNRTGSNVLRWDVRTWQKTATLSGHTGIVDSIAFSPDGRLMATTGGELRIWDVETGQSVAVINDRGRRVVFSPNGKWITMARTGRSPAIWEVGTWGKVAELSGHTQGVEAIRFSRDSSRVVTGSDDTTARLWETGTWRQIAVLEGHRGYVTNVEFSPDGAFVVTGSWDDTARLWDGRTGKLVAVLSGHTGSVFDARFSPDGRLIATAGGTTVQVWDGMTGKPVAVLRVFTAGLDSQGSERSVQAAVFSPDGKSLVASSSDNMTRIYSWEMFAPLEDLLALARTRVTRDLTSEEKQKFLHQAVAAGERLAPPQ